MGCAVHSLQVPETHDVQQRPWGARVIRGLVSGMLCARTLVGPGRSHVDGILGLLIETKIFE